MLSKTRGSRGNVRKGTAMGELWSQKALSLTPYVAGEQPEENLIKLNTNENAYAPSPCVKAVVEDACGDLRKYPPADGGPAREAAARMNGLRREEIFARTVQMKRSVLRLWPSLTRGNP